MTNEFKKHRENLLLEREKSLLPSTIPFVEEEVQKRNNKNRIAELQLRTLELKQEIELIHNEIIILKYGRPLRTPTANDDEAGPSNQEEKRLFVRNCVVDGCRGFLSSQWKCGICATWVCKDCHEVKTCQNDEEHKCNPDNVATAKELAKTTKPCPKCAAPIFKISGCSQMWCTLCHTTFSWNTGKAVVTERIHNPHYYTWLREQNNGNIPREPEDEANHLRLTEQNCYGRNLPGYNLIQTFVRNFNGIHVNISKIYEFYRCLIHIYDIDIRRRPRNDLETINRDLRVQYLLKDIDDETWKRTLHKREKKREFDEAKFLVLDMFHRVGSDLLQKLVNTHVKNTITLTMTEIASLIVYSSKSFNDVCKRFNSKKEHEMLNNLNTSWNNTN
jgi:hypothetical protein